MYPVTCFMCNETFFPPKKQVDDFMNSGHVYDPTDWECPACELAQAERDHEELEFCPPIGSCALCHCLVYKYDHFVKDDGCLFCSTTCASEGLDDTGT